MVAEHLKAQRRVRRGRHAPLAALLMRLAGCLLYLGGTLVVTGAFHVPRNDALAPSRGLPDLA